jgi:hypothetical protein
MPIIFPVLATKALSLSLHLLLHNFLFDEFLASLGTSGVLAFGEISRQ